MHGVVLKTKGDRRRMRKAESIVAGLRQKKRAEFSDLDRNLVVSVFRRLKKEGRGNSYNVVDTRRWNLTALREALKVLRRSMGYKMRPHDMEGLDR